MNATDAPIMPWQIAEEAMLAAALRDATVLDCVSLGHEEFSSDERVMLWRACRGLRSKGRLIEPASIHLLLAKHFPDEASLVRRCADMATELHGRMQGTEGVAGYAHTVREYARLRQFAAVLEQVHTLAAAGDLRALDKLPDVVAVAAGRAEDAELSWDTMVKNTVGDLEDIIAGKEPKTVPSGIPTLDRLSLLLPGDMVIVGARPSVGKSALALRTAMHAVEQGYPTLVVSMEMVYQKLIKRALSARAGIPAKQLKTGPISEAELGKIYTAATQMGPWPLTLLERGKLDLEAISNRARRCKSENGLALLIVDYVQLIRVVQTRGGNRNDAVGELSRAFKLLAGELECAVLCLAQLNRTADVGGNSRPTLSSLRESGNLEQDADSVLLLSPRLAGRKFEEWREDDVRDVLLDVAKSRDGETMDITLRFTASRVLFGEATYDDARRSA